MDSMIWVDSLVYSCFLESAFVSTVLCPVHCRILQLYGNMFSKVWSWELCLKSYSRTQVFFDSLGLFQLFTSLSLIEINQRQNEVSKNQREKHILMEVLTALKTCMKACKAWTYKSHKGLDLQKPQRLGPPKNNTKAWTYRSHKGLDVRKPQQSNKISWKPLKACTLFFAAMKRLEKKTIGIM